VSIKQGSPQTPIIAPASRIEFRSQAALRIGGRISAPKRLVVDRDKIRALAAGGLSTRAIAAKLKISHTSVHRIVQGKL
jgi:DNA-binding NarL/FixJ family response regulator